jgi:hypothetical protein
MHHDLRRRASEEEDPVVAEALEATADWVDRLPHELRKIALNLFVLEMNRHDDVSTESPWRNSYLVTHSNENEDIAVIVAVIAKHEFENNDAVNEAVDALVQSLDDEEVAS